MEWPAWQPYYQHIVAQFGFSVAGDEAAAALLARLLAAGGPPLPKGLARLKDRLAGAAVEVVGAALDPTGYTPGPGAVVVAADGAVAGLEAAGVAPAAVVTDLDGPPQALQRAAEAGAVTVVHAHGDNRHRLAWGVESLRPALGTCQCQPPPGLANFGGFTDGDRAVFLAASLGAARIQLVGFDFERVGAYSYHTDEQVKLAKLAWARRLVGVAGDHHGVRLLESQPGGVG